MEPPRSAVISPPRINETRLIEKSEHFFLEPVDVKELLFEECFDIIDTSGKKLLSVTPHLFAIHFHTALKNRHLKEPLRWLLVGTNAVFEIFTKIRNPYVTKNDLDLSDLRKSDDFDIRVEMDVEAIPLLEECIIEALHLISPRLDPFHIRHHGWERKKFVTDDNLHGLILAFGNRKGKRLDLCFYSRLEPKSLFSRDDAQLDITQAILNGSLANPLQNYFHPLQPIIDRKNKILRISEAEKVNEYGWPLLVYYLSKGYSLADPSQEAILFATFQRKVPKDKQKEYIDHVLKNHPLDDSRAFVFSFLSKLGASPDISFLPRLNQPYEALKCFAYLLHPHDPYIEEGGKKWHLPEPSSDCFKAAYQRRTTPFEFGIQHVVELAHKEGKNPLSNIPRRAFFFLRPILNRYPASELFMIRYRTLLAYKEVFQSVVAFELKDHLTDTQVFTFFFPHALLMPQLLDQVVEGIQNLTLSKKMYREALLQVKNNPPLLKKLLNILQKKGEIEADELKIAAESALIGIDQTKFLVNLFKGAIIPYLKEEIFEILLKHHSYDELKALFQGIDHEKVHAVLIKALLKEEKWKEACNLGYKYKLLPLVISTLIDKRVMEWLSKLLEKGLLMPREIEAFVEIAFNPPALPFLDIAFRNLESDKIPSQANQVLHAFLASSEEIPLKDRELFTPYFLAADVNLFIPFFTRYNELPVLKSEVYVEMYSKASPANREKLFEWALKRKVIKLNGVPYPEMSPPFSSSVIQRLKDYLSLSIMTPPEAIHLLSQDSVFHPWILELIQDQSPSYIETHFDSWKALVRLQTIHLLPRWSSERVERLSSELSPADARKLLANPKVAPDVLAKHLEMFYEESGYLDVVKMHPPKTREDYLKVFQHKEYLEAFFPKFLEEVRNGTISIDLESFRPFLRLILEHDSAMILECLNPPFIDCLSDPLEVLKLASNKILSPSSPLLPKLWDLAETLHFAPKALLMLSLQGGALPKFKEACLWIARDTSDHRSIRAELSVEAIKNYHRFEPSLKGSDQEGVVQQAIDTMIVRPIESTALSALASSPSHFLQMTCLKETILLFDSVSQINRGSEGEAVAKLIDKVFKEGQNVEACTLGRLIIEHPHASYFFAPESLRLLHQSHLLCLFKMAASMPLERKKAVVETLFSLEKYLPYHDSEFKHKLAHVYFDLIISYLEAGDKALFNLHLWKFYYLLIYEKAPSQDIVQRNQTEIISNYILPESSDLKVSDAKVSKIVAISKNLNQKLLKFKSFNEKTLQFVNEHLLRNLKYYFLGHKDIFLELLDQYLYSLPFPTIDQVKKRREDVKSILAAVVTSSTFDARRSFEYQVYMTLEYPPNAPKVILSEDLKIQALLRIFRFALQCDDFSFIDFLPFFRILDKAKNEWKNLENPDLVSLIEEFSKGVRTCPFYIEDNCSMIVFTTRFILSCLESLKNSPGKGAPFAIMQAKNILSAFKQADNEQREVMIRHSYNYMLECVRLNAFFTSLIPYYTLVEGLFPYYIPSLNFINRLDPITVLLINEPRGLIPLEKEVRAKTLNKWILVLFDGPGNTKLIPHHIINNFNIVHRVFNEAPQEKAKYEAALAERNILTEGLQEMVILKS